MCLSAYIRYHTEINSLDNIACNIYQARCPASFASTIAHFKYSSFTYSCVFILISLSFLQMPSILSTFLWFALQLLRLIFMKMVVMLQTLKRVGRAPHSKRFLLSLCRRLLSFTHSRIVARCEQVIFAVIGQYESLCNTEKKRTDKSYITPSASSTLLRYLSPLPCPSHTSLSISDPVSFLYSTCPVHSAMPAWSCGCEGAGSAGASGRDQTPADRLSRLGLCVSLCVACKRVSAPLLMYWYACFSSL